MSRIGPSSSGRALGSLESLIGQARTRLGYESKRAGREADKYRSWSPYSDEQMQFQAMSKARAADLGVSGTPSSFYKQILDEANANATLGQQEMQAASDRQGQVADEYHQHHNQLSAYMQGQQQKHLAEMEERKQSAIAEARRDMQMRGMTSAEAQNAVLAGIERGYAQQVQSAMTQGKLQELGMGTMTSGKALAAQGRALEQRAGSIQSQMAMRGAVSPILKQIEAAREDENRAIGAAELDYKKSVANVWLDSQRSKEQIRQANLGYFQGLQESAIRNDLAYAGLGQSTVDKAALLDAQRAQYVWSKRLRIGKMSSNTPNPVPWTEGGGPGQFAGYTSPTAARAGGIGSGGFGGRAPST